MIHKYWCKSCGKRIGVGDAWYCLNDECQAASRNSAIAEHCNRVPHDDIWDKRFVLKTTIGLRQDQFDRIKAHPFHIISNTKLEALKSGDRLSEIRNWDTVEKIEAARVAVIENSSCASDAYEKRLDSVRELGPMDRIRQLTDLLDHDIITIEKWRELMNMTTVRAPEVGDVWAYDGDDHWILMSERHDGTWLIERVLCGTKSVVSIGGKWSFVRAAV